MITVFIRSVCLALAASVAVVPSSLAQEFALNKDDLTVKFSLRALGGVPPKDCQLYEKQGTYHVTGRESGVLYNTNCTQRKGEGTFKFVDVSGSERCLGRMKIGGFISSEGPYTEWKVDGTVPGSRCSVVGQTFTFRGMNSSN